MESLVSSFARDLMRHRRYSYSQEPLEDFLMVNHQIGCSTFRIPNQKGYLLETLLLRNTKKTNTCILYAHGLGSNKLESLTIAKYFLKHGYDLCSFDFSGSGRSEGELTTYGLNEKDDLLAILKHLELTENYQKIVLWGRSMGAVAVALSQQQVSSRVDCLILDSPFSSFQKIAIEIAAKKSFIPQFMLQVLIQPLKEHFRTREEGNPFSIDLENILKKIDTPILLIYSPQDSVVSCSHSKAIVKFCKKNPKEIVIEEDHNMQRSKSTLHQSLLFITDTAREADRKAAFGRSRNRGISVASKDARERESIRSRTKLKLVQATSSLKLTSRQSSTSKISERHMHTVGSLEGGLNQSLADTLNGSVQYRRRRETGVQGKKKQSLCYLLMDSKVPQHRLLRGANKQNMKPSLNLLRKNRFK